MGSIHFDSSSSYQTAMKTYHIFVSILSIAFSTPGLTTAPTITFGPSANYQKPPVRRSFRETTASLTKHRQKQANPVVMALLSLQTSVRVFLLEVSIFSLGQSYKTNWPKVSMAYALMVLPKTAPTHCPGIWLWSKPSWPEILPSLLLVLP